LKRNMDRRPPMSERVRETVPCPRRGCGGTAVGEVEYLDGDGSEGERIVHWILDCRKCGYCEAESDNVGPWPPSGLKGPLQHGRNKDAVCAVSHLIVD
jgi:hypothetical protein